MVLKADADGQYVGVALTEYVSKAEAKDVSDKLIELVVKSE
jgi:hypothetical protein